MMILNLFRRKSRENEIITLGIYDKIVASARQKRFYAEFLVPDTPIGRYEMLSLHMFLLMYRLKGDDSVKLTNGMQSLSQALAEEFFKDVDHSLRELGIGDTGVPKRMKKLARMYYGRVSSYNDALVNKDVSELQTALSRNIRPDLIEAGQEWQQAKALTEYVLATVEGLALQADEKFLDGSFVFNDA